MSNRIFFHRLYQQDGFRYEEPVEKPEIGTRWVYFIEQGPQGPIKVGFSMDPLFRLKRLQTASAETLRLICCLESDRILETALHRQLCKDQIQGEWFRREAVHRWLRTFLQDFEGSNQLIF